MAGGGIASAAITNLALPALQALATITLLKYQKSQYDSLSAARVAILDRCVADYCASMDATIGSGLFTKAYGSVPTPAEYVSVDELSVQCATINDNLRRALACILCRHK
mgnify:CR=1 FL=1